MLFVNSIPQTGDILQTHSACSKRWAWQESVHTAMLVKDKSLNVREWHLAILIQEYSLINIKIRLKIFLIEIANDEVIALLQPENKYLLTLITALSKLKSYYFAGHFITRWKLCVQTTVMRSTWRLKTHSHTIVPRQIRQNFGFRSRPIVLLTLPPDVSERRNPPKRQNHPNTFRQGSVQKTSVCLLLCTGVHLSISIFQYIPGIFLRRDIAQ